MNESIENLLVQMIYKSFIYVPFNSLFIRNVRKDQITFLIIIPGGLHKVTKGKVN